MTLFDLNLAKEVSLERPVFIFSSGQRAGSTLLQRLLNSCREVLIWGEHGGYLSGLLWNYRTLLDWEKRQSHYRKVFLNEGYDTFVPNLMPESEEIRDSLVLHLYGLFGLPAVKLGRSTWGFKEVRYGADIALHLQECFPDARFIHLTRNVVDCLISMKRWEEAEDIQWERSWTKKSISDWEAINRSFYQLGSQFSHLLSVKYEQVVADPAGFIRQLAGFLEMREGSFDARVFNNRIHGPGKEGREKRKEKILPAHLDQEEREILSRPELQEMAQIYGYSIELG
jgi:hypothetical protein